MTEYVFDTGSDNGRIQVTHLSEMYDLATQEVLERTGVSGSRRCLEIGAGNGSVAALLAGQIAPGGSVLATDIETSYIEPSDAVTTVRHDLNEGVPAGGPFDLIHARLVLMHLSRRHELLAMLADALEPGGWLVVGDLGEHLPRTLDAPSVEDAELVDRVIRVGMSELAPQVGMSSSWAEDLGNTMRSVGLSDVDTKRISQSCAGGTSGCFVMRSYVHQLEAPLRSLGVTVDELARFANLMSDPRVRISFFELIYASGRKAESTS